MIKKIVLVFIIALIMFVLWTIGLEKIYAYIMLYLAYLPVHMVPDTSLNLTIENGNPVYTVVTLINAKEYTWSLNGELFLLPIVLLVSWQIALFFFVPLKQSKHIARNNLIVMILCQLLYLFMLVLYWKSSLIRVIHDMMNNNLIIVAVFLIIKDIIRYNILNYTNKYEKT